MVSEFSRRGQAASGAAVLVAVIAGLLILYILFLSPEDRDALLGGGLGGGSYGGGQGGGVNYVAGPTLLLTESPGTLRLLTSPFQEHNIPSATIFTRLNTEAVKTIDSAIVKNGVFAQQDLTITFAARKESGNHLLSFNVVEAAHGPLRILLNGNLIFERQILNPSPPPIQLPADYLVDGENVIVLQTADAGLAFWKPNAYVFNNILLSADVFDASGSVAEQSFSLSEQEYIDFESAQLQFIPDCNPNEAGRLNVHLNSRFFTDSSGQQYETPNVLYTGFVDCGVTFKTDVPKEYLRSGQNRLLFASAQGSYIVDRIKLSVRLREADYPVYYVNIPPDMYDVLDIGQRQMVLTLVFSDYRAVKTGEIVVNGFVQTFNTQDRAWQGVVDPAILTPGPNTFQVAPQVDRLDVAEIKVELV